MMYTTKEVRTKSRVEELRWLADVVSDLARNYPEHHTGVLRETLATLLVSIEEEEAAIEAAFKRKQRNQCKIKR